MCSPILNDEKCIIHNLAKTLLISGMKKLPIGLQNFKEIIESGYLYVDKTRQVYDLIDKGKLYFLSRPRRFGKSLLITTLRYIFNGEKDLFKGLYIAEQTDYNWEKHPVLKFNFAIISKETSSLERGITYILQDYAQQYGVTIPDSDIRLQFNFLVKRIAEKYAPVVVLIDEYDKPIIDFLTEPEKAKENRAVLGEFFSPLKELDSEQHLRFLFITGVSKFSKVSLFSDLNNLQDLTMRKRSADLLGITHQELSTYFKDRIGLAATHYKISEKQLLEDVKLWYNGYSYDGVTKLYNPFSILNFFDEFQFNNYWFATGTPTFLVETIRDRGIHPQELEEIKVNIDFFDKFSLEALEMSGLLFQTGYLTVKRVEHRGYRTNYFLGYPNNEVHNAFTHNLLQAFTYKQQGTVGNALIRMQEGLEEGDLEAFIRQLKVLLADISYHLHPKNKPGEESFKMWEGYFHTIIYLITSFLSLDVQSEVTKHKGRLDLSVETPKFLYLMEFKLDEPAENAIQQIKNRDYIQSYTNVEKTIYLVGVGFSKTERNVETWEAEIWER